MTKSKSFWAVLAIISLAAAGFSGYSIYNRLTIYFASDSAEIRTRPVPPLAEPDEAGEEPAAADKTGPQPADKGSKDKEPKQEPQKQRAVKTVFTYKSATAKKVSLSGTFTKWEKIAMSKKDGVWKADVYILPGTYPYYFTVDGKKTLDPGKPKAPTGDSLAVVGDVKPADGKPSAAAKP